MKARIATTCKKCNRVVWESDVNEDGFCCYCAPKAMRGSMQNVAPATRVFVRAGEVVEIKPGKTKKGKRGKESP